MKVELEKETNSTVSDFEIDIMQKLLESQHVTMRIDDIKAMITDDRALANAYLDAYQVDKETMSEIRFIVEKKLSELYVQKYEKSLVLNDDTLRSYYIDHNDEFSHKIMVNAEFFNFSDFNSAYRFYAQGKTDLDKLEVLAQENNATFKTYEVNVQNLNDAIKWAMKPIEEENYLLPPLFFTNHFTVVYIKKIRTNVQLPYDEKMKKRIREFLIKKNRNNIRIKLLKKLDHEK